MQTDYTAIYWRDIKSLEVSDGHDNQVLLVECPEDLAVKYLLEKFGTMGHSIPLEYEDAPQSYNVAHHEPTDP